jgi:hypothetical protein
MWVIVVNKDLQEFRDSTLSDIIGGNKPKENYLNYRFSRYNYGTFLPEAKVYKTKSGAEKVITQIKNTDNSSWRSKYYNLWQTHLSCRKLSRHEWHDIVNFELAKLERSYQIRKSKLEKKKTQFPLS